MTVKLNMKALHRVVDIKHQQCRVGQVYFLSHFLDKEGAMVRVLSKSTKTNKAGFRSSVNIEVLESDCDYYRPGAKHTVNAANLYKERHHANPVFKINNRN